MKKKLSVSFIAAAMLIFALSIWPFGFVRKDIVYQTESSAYQESVYNQNTVVSMEQTFTAQETMLKELAFAVTFAGEECEALFRLCDANANLIIEQAVVIPESESSRFYHVTVNKRLKKGADYRLSVEVREALDVKPQFLYTQNGERTAQGNKELLVNGEHSDGQAVTWYLYGGCLNYKNVICIWAAILVLGLSFIEIINGTKKNKLCEKMNAILERYQYLFLVAEILVITLLLIRSSATLAVDWDEAYTWNIVTQNSLMGVISMQAIDNHPPLYFLMVKVATLLFGSTMLVFKMVSIMGGVATMALGATLVRKRWGVKAAIPFILTAGLGTQFGFYNLNLRMYSWMVFFVVAAALFSYEIVLEDKRNYWIGLVLVSLGALYTQYFAVVPLFLIYAYLLVVCVGKKKIKKFVISCVSVVVAYLPQVYLVFRMLKRDSGAVSDEMQASLNLVELCKWSFQTNIKWSEYMPLVLYLSAILLLKLEWSVLKKKERGFAVMAAGLYPITCIICYIISANMNHFWHNRYMLPALLFLWLFAAIIYAKRRFAVWVCFCVWEGIMSLSAYGIVHAAEMATIPYIVDAKEKLSAIQEEKIIVYNYSTYDVLYKYYLPNAEFVWYEDLDFSELEGDCVYMISWGGAGFSEELIEEYNISVEYTTFFRLEEGVADVALCKVHFEN